MGEPYDHFEGDVGRHLAAVAYNASIEWHYLKKFGHVAHPLTLPSVKQKGSWIAGEWVAQINIAGAAARLTRADVARLVDSACRVRDRLP